MDTYTVPTLAETLRPTVEAIHPRWRVGETFPQRGNACIVWDKGNCEVPHGGTCWDLRQHTLFDQLPDLPFDVNGQERRNYNSWGGYHIYVLLSA